MKIRTMALFSGFAFAVVGAGAVACSSSNSGNPSSGDDDSGTGIINHDGGNTQPDTGTTQPGDDDSGSTVGNNDAGAVDSGPCKSAALHPNTVDGGGIYCPYSYNDATDAGIQYCTVGTQQCCLSASTDAGSSVCSTFDNSTAAYNGDVGSCPNNDKMWQCAEPSDCTAAGPVITGGPAGDAGDTDIVCCLVGGTPEAITTAGYCSGQNKLSYFGGTTCSTKSACLGGSLPYGDAGKTDTLYVACQKDSDCPGITNSSGQHTQTCQALFVSGTSIGVCTPAD